MATQEKTALEPIELRIPNCPPDVYLRIEKYMSLVHVNEGRRLLKWEATLELLKSATKHIAIP